MNDARTLPRRKSIRLKGYDYSAAGAYFVTICTQDHRCLFGDVVEDRMRLNACGGIVWDVWAGLMARYRNAALDEFVVMPNHLHGIVILGVMDHQGVINHARTDGGAGPGRGAIHCAQMNHGARDDCAQINAKGVINHPGVINHARTLGEMGAVNRRAGAAGVPPLGEIVRAFKAVAARRIRQSIAPAFAWQRNYYERIIRDDEGMNRVRGYILANPARWQIDRDYHQEIQGAERRMGSNGK